jgi:3-oxoacyl-[acyl-carrier-protein] synthase II
MSIYIRGAAAISPQKTFNTDSFLTEPVEHTTDYLNCCEPDYKAYLDPKISRRMGRIIKMGVATSAECLKDADITLPDAILVGTGLGCMEDTEKFLTALISNGERLLTPTAFIQSTHNTVGAQIALGLGCHEYNFTYVHRGFSLESALTDAILLLQEKEANNVLVGGIDEMTGFNHTIISQRDTYVKKGPRNNLTLLNSESDGTLIGEGSSFFILSNEKHPSNYAELLAVKMLYKPANQAEIEKEIIAVLKQNNLSINDIDLVIAGNNGDKESDKIYSQLQKKLFSNIGYAAYKHLCGEFHTASGFALWLAANVVKKQELPAITVINQPKSKSFKHVLIYNYYRNSNHSIMLIKQS